MKTLLCTVAGLVIYTTSIPAQIQQNISITNQLARAGYRVVESSPNTRTWTGLTLRSNQLGGLELTTNAVVEIGGGLNRWVSALGQWAECAPELVLTNDAILGRGARHTLRLAGNLNTRGAVEILLPGEGQAQYLRTHVLALAYSSAETNIVVAAIRDSTAKLLADGRVLYEDAFAGLISADVAYSYSTAGLMQCIILRTRPPLPEDLGLQGPVQLVAITEVVDGPEPQIVPHTSQDGAEIVQDEQLDFGPMAMTPGRAFLLREQDAGTRWRGPVVLKQYQVIDGRRFIFERLDLDCFGQELLELPLPEIPTNAGLSKIPRTHSTLTFDIRVWHHN